MSGIEKTTKLLFITAAGGALEFYDFTLFMLFSPNIRTAFFPESGAIGGLFGVMLLFFAGYLARPLGGLLFSHFGDRYGRKRQFLITLSVMSFSTLALSLTPTKETIGSAAVIIVMFLRILQGASLGGEIPGSVVYMAEWLPRQRRGRYISVIIMAITFGNLAGALTGYTLTSILSDVQMQCWGWRLPFIFGFILGMVLLLIRRRLKETPQFVELAATGQTVSNPLLTLIRQSPELIFQGIGLASVPAAMISFYLYLPIWLGQHLQWPITTSFSISTLAFLTICVQVPLYGWLSDQVGRRVLVIAGSLLLIPGLWLSHQLLMGDTEYYATLPLILLTALPAGMIQATYETAMVELFPTPVRYTGLALSHNIGFTLFGGVFPLAAEYLITDGLLMAPLYLVGTCAIINLLTACTLPAYQPEQRLIKP